DGSQRGKGYGKEIMLHAMRFAESMGAKSIDLTSRPFRIAANQLYIDLGFEKRDTNVYRYHVIPPKSSW
ncbi:MAG: GNAT family N-acetyltransferase, partial [Lutibacter sp.]